MPLLAQAQQLKDFAEEIFEVSKGVWALQSRSKARHQAEITETEFLALDFLAKTEQPVTVGDIQRHIGVLPAQMSRIIRTLERKSEQPLVVCKINSQDKRKVDVQVTPAGRQAHEAYRHLKLAMTEQILQALSEEDRAEFVRLMRLIREAMRKP
jgi:DNA-binding MarR family transcriptional regulator